MKKLILTLLCACTAAGLRAQSGREWLDPAVNAVNRAPMHAALFAYESSDAARTGDRTASARYLRLDGLWKFHWVRHADQRPTTFYRTDFDDAAWDTMPVPGMWEMNGYGDPVYLNVGYAWREQFANNPPEVPVAENHVGSYRREIEIPASWSGEQILAHFGSVTSNIYLWVNGRFAGYSEDSKLEAEFDITQLVKPGRNLLAFQVFRWSDGTYLEDQDFFRLSGVARDCYLYARDCRHVADVRLGTSLSEHYTRGTLDVEMEFSDAAKGCTAEVTLSDAEGRIMASQRTKVTGTTQHVTLDAGTVQPWSAEIPALYGVLVSLKAPDNAEIEAIPLRTGFREVRIKGGQLLVNGQPVLIKGANRHEIDPDGGYVVSEERMKEDIRILRENNFNAVRTCHYPDDNRWYDLCDQYGIYLVAEANVESHGMGYGEKSLAKNPAFAKAHLERNLRNVRRNINHPSVIIWSLGNEAGDGANFDACYDRVKALDASRPVHYERTLDYARKTTGRNSDIMCPMYAGYSWCEAYCTAKPTAPLIQCEYAHAMGNSLGGFGEYWRLIRKYPHYQGGFIWDFVDQGLRKTGRDGAMIYGYGGDWNPYDASDANFCDNGLISPDRIPNPHMHEARYWQQNVWTTLGKDRRTLTVFNENFFRPLTNRYLRWTVLLDGEPVRSGIVTDLHAAPQQTQRLTLPYDPATLPADGELLLNVEYRLCDAEPLLAPDHVAARQQFMLRKGAPAEMAVTESGRHASSEKVGVRDNDRHYLIVESPCMRIDFRRSDGLMTRYEADGMRLLDEGAVLEPNFWRAPTDNDFGAGLQRKNRVWADPGLKLVSLEHAVQEGEAVVTAHYRLQHVTALLEIQYRIGAGGAVLVRERLHAAADTGAPALMRFGMRMRLPARCDRIDYYGRGPWENYADRKDGAFLGRYRQTVEEQFYPYIRPQETGTKSDVRRWRQADLAGRGVEITAPEPFSASALHYSRESLDEGLEKRQGHSQEIAPDKAVWLSIDKAQYGLGCVNSWGALPLPQYRLPYGDYDFCFLIRPVR